MWVEIGGVIRCWERSGECEKVWGEVRVLGRGKSVPHLSPHPSTLPHTFPDLPPHFPTPPWPSPPPTSQVNLKN